MSSVVELDKENQEQQTVSRKVVVPESSAPRTPFGDVNRRRSVAADPTGGFLKCNQLPAKRRSWAPDGLVQRQAYSSGDALFTPLRNKAKEISLKKQILKEKEDLEGHEERTFCTQTTEAMCFSSSQSSCPVMKLPKSDSTEQLLPVSSQSCPDVLSDNLPLPPIKETSPEKPTACLSVAVGDLPALSPEQNTSHSPDLSMNCEEGTPLALRDLSCKTESDVDLSYDCRDLSGSPTPALGMSSSSVMSDEGISSEANSPEKNAILTGTCGLQGMIASVSEGESESVQTACFILDEILEAVEEQTMMNQPEDNNVKGTCQTFSNPHASYGQTFLLEYARFVESYSREESPFCVGRTSSLTDVTPCSQDLEVESSTSSVGCAAPSDGQPVMVDSFGSSFLDSDKSFSSTGTVQRQLTFEDRDMRSPEANLNESFGFVRSSESKVDLREHPGGVTPYKLRTERGDSAERDFLNLSLSDQGVEFIALPPKLRSVASSPIDVQNQNQSCSSVSVWGNTSPLSGTVSQETGTPTSAELMKDVEIITAGAEVKSTLEVVKSCAVQTTPRLTHTHSIAESPIPAEVCEQEANTSIIQTVDVDTMTLVLPTTEVALSPMPVARKEVDTMTTIAVTTDVGMATESAECLDHSMLATAETDSKTTMTDSTGHRNVFTTMTPLKALAKEGQRLTSNDIRKQHPRALANQLETLTVANSRLESQVRSAQQEHKRLQGALKEAKQLASSRQSEVEAADRLKQEEWEQKERELKDRYQHLEEESQQQQSRVVGLERELLTMRAESEATTQRQLEELRVMEEKCQVMEETHARSAKQYQLEIEELKKNQEADSYRHQFERAQQMVREREAEVKEIRELFADLQNTACQQEKIHSAYQQMHKKIIALASENQTLRDSIANRTWLSREEAECRQAEMVALQEDKARLEEEVQSLKNTLAIHTTNLAELEKLYSVSSTDLLTATGRVVDLNSELFAARKALQEAVLSKETMCRHSQELEEQLWGLRDTETSLRAALQHTQDQLELQIQAHEKLQSVSQKMKKVYEDKIENMALGVENLQRTLENREVDMNNLEKDLYEVRNIIVEQRYRIDGLETDLRDARNEAAAKKAEEEDIEFFKESNAFLEAERSLYVQSIRDLEENLKATLLESVKHKQVAADAEQLVEELQEDKLRLISELSLAQSQYVTTSKALSQAREECEAMEADLMVAANDLLQHMQLMLTKLKTKIGLQEVPEVYPLEAQPPRPPHHSKPIRSRRHSRKSFVSSILGAATKVSEQGAESNATEQDNDQWESGSYLGEAMTDSVRKAVAAKSAKLLNASSASNTEGSMVKRDVKEVTVTTAVTTLKDQSLSRLDTSSACSDSHPLSVSRRKLHFSDHQPLSVSWTESSTCNRAESGAHAGRSAHASPSSLPSCPPYSLLHPPSSEPLSSGLAKVRSIPRTHYNPAMLHPGPPCVDKEGERGMMGCMLSLKEVFSSISRMASIVDRATQLSLQDLREENDILRKRTEILEGWVDRNKAELMVSQQESADKDNTIVKLRQQFQEMTEQMMNFTDQKFQIRRLREEVKRLESDMQHERSEKEVVSAELDSQLRRLESAGAGASQAHRLRDLVALKKKNGQLIIQLEEQRNHYENLGSKAARRMRVLDENWKKAEDELYRLDEVVEGIKQIAEHSSSPVSDLQKILRLIQGETKVSPL